MFSLALLFGLAGCASEAVVSNGSTPETAVAEPMAKWAAVEAAPPVEQFDFSASTKEPASLPSTLSLAEVQAELPFAFDLPTWTPAGCALQAEVEYVPTMAVLTWLRDDGADFILQVSSAGPSQMGAAGTVEQAVVQGQPASLTRGGLKHTRLSLSWALNGVVYTLSSDEASLSAEDLKKLAESFK